MATFNLNDFLPFSFFLVRPFFRKNYKLSVQKEKKYSYGFILLQSVDSFVQKYKEKPQQEKETTHKEKQAFVEPKIFASKHLSRFMFKL